MEAVCAACEQSLTVSEDQIGRSIRCPACEAVMQIHQPGQAQADQLVTCPGCKNRLAIPESQNAATFRCPKCDQFLATPKVESDRRWAVESNAPPTVGLDDLLGPATDSIGLGNPAAAAQSKPTKQSSTAWKSKTAYSDQVGSVVPGALIMIQACLGILLDFGQFFYAMGINDVERLADEEVRALKTLTIGWSIVGGIYLAAMGLGALQMITRRRLWAGRTTCIFAVLPITVFAYGPLSPVAAIPLYPIAVLGGVWGLCVLFGRHTRPTPSVPL